MIAQPLRAAIAAASRDGLEHVRHVARIVPGPRHDLRARIFGRHGIDLSRTTLCGWVADVAAALAPIGDQLRLEVTAVTYLQTDDTPVTILDERAGSIKGRLWTYLDPLGRQVVVDATPTHERDGPEAFLAGFRGDLQADAYTGYDALYATGRVREIGCWAHARRGFVEALPTDVRAALMVALIQQLYQVEHAGVDLSADARRALRQEQSLPLLGKIQAERETLSQAVLPKSPLGDASRTCAAGDVLRPALWLAASPACFGTAPVAS